MKKIAENSYSIYDSYYSIDIIKTIYNHTNAMGIRHLSYIKNKEAQRKSKREGEIKNGEIKESKIKESEIKEGEIKKGEIKENKRKKIPKNLSTRAKIKEYNKCCNTCSNDKKNCTFSVSSGINWFFSFLKPSSIDGDRELLLKQSD
jgi:hypothetical protein